MVYKIVYASQNLVKKKQFYNQNHHSSCTVDLQIYLANIFKSLDDTFVQRFHVNLSAFIYGLFHEDFSSIVGTNTVAYSQPSTGFIYSNFGVCVGGWGGLNR